jgi:hypothetical protein
MEPRVLGVDVWEAIWIQKLQKYSFLIRFGSLFGCFWDHVGAQIEERCYTKCQRRAIKRVVRNLEENEVCGCSNCEQCHAFANAINITTKSKYNQKYENKEND